MFSKKVDARTMHKFIKENLCEECTTVDLRPTPYDKYNLKFGLIYIKTNDGLEPNYIMFNDRKFCIMTSNKTKNEKLNALSPEQVNQLWDKFLCNTFGTSFILSKNLTQDICR